MDFQIVFSKRDFHVKSFQMCVQIPIPYPIFDQTGDIFDHIERNHPQFDSMWPYLSQQSVTIALNEIY